MGQEFIICTCARFAYALRALTLITVFSRYICIKALQSLLQAAWGTVPPFGCIVVRVARVKTMTSLMIFSPRAE